MKLFGKSAKPLQYSSTPTRFVSLDNFMGGAQGDEINEAPAILPCDSSENLERKFNSGVNRTDCPRMWGYAVPYSSRRLANRSFQLADDIASWRRQNGEPLYKKK